MTAKELAEMLDGREYLSEMSHNEDMEAFYNGLVVVTGYSDDCVEFMGAIDDEIVAFEGRKIYINKDGNISARKFDNGLCNEIKAVWGGDKAPWTFETDIPHETFNIFEGDELFCVGIVFNIDDLK